jgi:hypothetical protein
MDLSSAIEAVLTATSFLTCLVLLARANVHHRKERLMKVERAIFYSGTSNDASIKIRATHNIGPTPLQLDAGDILDITGRICVSSPVTLQTGDKILLTIK